MSILAGWVINYNWVMSNLAGWVINYNWVMPILAGWVINYNWVMSIPARWVINYSWVMSNLAGWVINYNWVMSILAGWVINYNWVNSWVVRRVKTWNSAPKVLKWRILGGINCLALLITCSSYSSRTLFCSLSNALSSATPAAGRERWRAIAASVARSSHSNNSSSDWPDRHHHPLRSLPPFIGIHHDCRYPGACARKELPWSAFWPSKSLPQRKRCVHTTVIYMVSRGAICVLLDNPVKSLCIVKN